MLSTIRKIALVAACLICAVNATRADEWAVEKVSGPAEVLSEGRSWAPLSTGASIPNDSWVRTGPRGRIFLRRNQETILLRPETLASVLSLEGGLLKTVIGQRRGSLLLNIEKRIGKHTTVRTPFLAAVVKGTRFVVNVSESGAAVSVLEGVVETVDTRSGDRADVHAGQHVVVSAAVDGPMEVRGAASKRSEASASPLTPLRSSPSGASVAVAKDAADAATVRLAQGTLGGSARPATVVTDDVAADTGLASYFLLIILAGAVFLLWLLRTIDIALTPGESERNGNRTRGGSRRRG